MRLGNKVTSIIKQAILSSFGDVDVYLFGSRVDDDKYGGDIDLAIDIEISREKFRKTKIKFITSLIQLGYDLKIDIVPYNTKDPLLFHEIHTKGVKI